MPFNFTKQAKFLFANKPSVAKEFSEKGGYPQRKAIKANPESNARNKAIVKRMKSIKLKRNDS